MATNNDIVADFEAWQTALFAALVQATKAANAIPAGDVSFYRTLDRTFAADMDEASTSTLDLCNRLLRQAGGPVARQLKDSDDVSDHFSIVVDVVDNMLEKVDLAMDEMRDPRKKGTAASVTMPQGAPIVAVAKSDKLEYKYYHAQNIARPQLRFQDQVDNSSSPFVRKIKHKPNAQVDLNYGMDRLGNDSSLTQPVVQPHPYEYEIKHLEYPQHMFEQRPEQLYTPFDATSPIWVDTEEALKDMCRTLEMQREISVDLEHHNYRSYQGFVCLMQISTRDQDFVIDTLELRGSLHLLNQSFTDPNIVKVLHGAESDIIWLQRDFGVYIVNLFDTYHASKLLEFGAHSLAHLLKLYADYDADKKYQMADWRIRPLPKEMLTYARSDTHFLLYIYDRMRNALLDKSNPTTHNLLRATLLRSSETALRVHEKEVYDAEGGDGPGGWRNTYAKWNRAFNNMQFAVFKALHAWRDQMARDEDESIRYVLPNSMLFTLADKMPVEASGVVACCTPVPPPVKMNAHDIAMLISQTKSSMMSTPGGLKTVEIEVPVHVRFNPKTGLQGTGEVKGAVQGSSSTTLSTPLSKAEQSGGGKVVAAASSGMFGKSAVQGPAAVSTPVADAMPLMAKRSGMFGNLTTLNSSQAEEEGKRIALRIMQELSSQPAEAAPVFKEITEVTKPTATVPEEEIKEEVLFTPKEERVTKQKRTDVLVLSSMSKKRSRAMDEERAELEQENSEAAAGSGSVDGAGQDDETVSQVSLKKKKNKTGKDKRSASGTPASSVPGTDDEKDNAFAPFDYSTVRSAVDERIAEASSNKKRNKKKAAADSEASKPFDPYSKLEEKSSLQKKDATFSRNPKSGARSMTFGKN
ncbi:exosome nuclease subunit [Dissophora globulifera]|uniref:Exosome nuclease subunit n=1 Tax=Dissophora globulifera TaxID=979702 RepID=A0A9P6UY67_9FUNG|nr:exosome nuclease subunit [Dissophora globulifera]